MRLCVIYGAAWRHLRASSLRSACLAAKRERNDEVKWLKNQRKKKESEERKKKDRGAASAEEQNAICGGVVAAYRE